MIKLSNILADIKREQKRTIKEFRKEAINSISLQAILNSNGLPSEQTIALKKFFEYYNNGNVPILNESTIKRIDMQLSSVVLSEGFSDWIAKVGSKAKEWLSSGWENVKKVWSNFNDVISKLIEKIKEFFKNLASASYDKVQQLISKLTSALESTTESAKNHLKNFTSEAITKEWSTITASVKHLASKAQEYITGTSWSDQLSSGSVSPASGTTTESVNKKPKLIFNKSLVEALLILEAGFHFEDLINKKKYPVLHKIVKWGLTLLSWIFSPINTALKYLAKFLVSGWKKDGSSGALVWINVAAEKLGGPKTIYYPILGVLCMELTEIALTGLNLQTHGKMLGSLQVGIQVVDSLNINIWEWFHEFIKEYVPGLGTAIMVLEIIFVIYALGNFIVNVFPGFIKKVNPDISLSH